MVKSVDVDGDWRGELDRTPRPEAPLDILAQQIVAAVSVSP